MAATDDEKMGESVFKKTRMKLFFASGSLALYAVIIWFVQTTFSAVAATRQSRALDSVLRLDASTTLALFRVSQGLLATTCSSALQGVFELLQWRLLTRIRGLNYLTAITLSPATGYYGTLRVLFSHRTTSFHKLWASLKVLLMTSLWISTIALFFRTSIVTVYDTMMSYDVTAGIGPFNSSYVDPFFENLQSLAAEYHYQVVPYSYFAPVYNLVVNPVYSTLSTPVQCRQGEGCDSYLLSGGLIMATPWVPPDHPNIPMVKLDSVPAVQLEFEQRPEDDFFIDADCVTYGANGILIGIQLCVRSLESDPRTLVAGLYVCRNGTEGNFCKTDYPTPNITTTMSLYTRQATIIAAKANLSIAAVSDLSPPVPHDRIDIPAYVKTLSWLLNYTAADIPAPSSMAQYFWNGQEQLLHPASKIVLLQSFHSLLAFPLWMFNANNFGNVGLRSKEIVPTLPRDFYATASVVAPYVKIQFDRAMFLIFAVLQGAVLVFIWAVLVWTWCTVSFLPNISSYALFDWTFKVSTDLGVDRRQLLDAGDAYVLGLAKDARSSLKVE